MSSPGVRPAKPGPIRRRVPHFRGVLPVMAVLLVGAVVVGALVSGVPGALGAALGVGGVTVSYIISGLAIAWADSISPQMVMPVGLSTYAIKFCILGAVLATTYDTDWPGLNAMIVAIIVAVVVWNAAHLTWQLRARIPYVELDETR